MEQALQQFVGAFGLSPREQSVFSALLGKGFQPASRIARSTSLPRNTTRNILDRLVDLGLVTRSKRINSNLYRIESISNLQRNLIDQHRTWEQKLKERLKVLKTLGPHLEQLGGMSKKPSISFYEGLEGCQRVYEDTLSSKEPIRGWANFDANSKALPDYFKTYYRRRAGKKIAIKLIATDTQFARVRTSRNKEEKRECVLIPEKIFSIFPEIQVYDNKISLVSWEDKLGILIESQELSKAIKTIFDLNYLLAQRTFGVKLPKPNKNTR